MNKSFQSKGVKEHKNRVGSSWDGTEQKVCEKYSSGFTLPAPAISRVARLPIQVDFDLKSIKTFVDRDDGFDSQ